MKTLFEAVPQNSLSQMSFFDNFSQISSIVVSAEPMVAEEVDITNDSSVAEVVGPKNYLLTDDDFAYKGGAKTRFVHNVEAIKLVKLLDQEQRQATPDEQKILARYVGWGGIPQAFDNTKADWASEYEELQTLLEPHEYDLAKSSVLNAHYTSKVVIDGIYKILAHMGLTNGKVLEPAMGTGNFVGLAPDTLNRKDIFGVEVDEITGQIAKHLYPQCNISVTGFENTAFKNDEFDAVITNVPFGSYKVFDRDYDKFNMFIHDYFIAKSIDKVRPGGIVAVITTKGSLDKSNSSVRKHFADRAELLGAIRLPNDAFKQNAGTQVTTDILFFMKRPVVVDSQDIWIEIGVNDEDIPLNNYYIENPKMLFGNMKKGVSMYGSETETYLESDGRELSTAFLEVLQHFPQDIYKQAEKPKPTFGVVDETLPADYDVPNFCFEIINNRAYMRINDKMHPQRISSNNIDRLRRMIDIRKLVRRLLDLQIKNCTDEELKSEQSELDYKYTSFVRYYGFLNTKVNTSVFRNDADFPLVLALEHYDDKTKRAIKTDIFTKRTIRRHERVTQASSSVEGLQISKNELGKVDLRYIEQLTGFDYDTIIRDLEQYIYKSPDFIFDENADTRYSGWQTASEYLSGNVKQKLRIARRVAVDDPTFERNVKALELALPEDIPAEHVSVRMGASWIDRDIYRQFIAEKFNIHYHVRDELKLMFNSYAGVWHIEAPPFMRNMQSREVYGTERMNGFKIAEHCLNLQTPSIYDEVEQGDGTKKRVLNNPETIAAREKQQKLLTEFKDWIFDCPDRRNSLVEKYNDTFNNIKLAEFDGNYLTFPEMNPEIELKDYQKDAVERIITNGNTLLHHVVGAGKTFEMVAAVMKLRQYGLAHKPMIVVPNHLVMQWTREFKLLYPNANVLMATKKDLEKTNRQKFVSRVATGDWDAVIIAASSFEKIPLSRERQEKKLATEIASITMALEEARAENDRLTVKIMQATLKNKEAIMKKLLEGKTKDTLIKFEDLGVDHIFVDEAHKYKNKFIFTKMNNVSGISRAMSQRATDLDMKCEFINELHGGPKGIVFATGTPISNSMVEMYTMQSYLQRDALLERGIHYFDSWAANFGETQTALELAPSGQGYRTRTRFSKFTNLPELLTMYRSVADVKTADMLDLPVPRANKITILTKPSGDILRLNAGIQERADLIYNGGDNKPDPKIDNMLKITSDGKKLALDPRILDRASFDDPENKINKVVENIYRIWDETQEGRKTQVVFCDLSVPKVEYELYDPDQHFDVYNDIKRKLVTQGIPEHEIQFIHTANTDLRKQVLFDDVRNGNVRIIMGSTEKCGAGTNMQDKLIALHHLDTPYRPSDLAQREGRIIRQGNKNAEVWIYTYVTERTFDSYSYQILENKQKFIAQIDRGDLSVREAADIDETTLSYAEIKAITTANPKIKQKMELEAEISRLQTLEGQYRKNKYRLQDAITKSYPQTISTLTTHIECLEKDIELRNAHRTAEFTMQIGVKHFTERRAAGDLLIPAVNSGKYDGKIIAKFCGFNLVPATGRVQMDIKDLFIQGHGRYNVEIGTSELGGIARIENALEGLDKRLATAQEQLLSANRDLETARKEVDRAFEHAETLAELNKQLAEINAELDLGKEKVELTVVDDQQLAKEVALDQNDIDELTDDDDNELDELQNFIDEGASDIIDQDPDLSGYADDDTTP